MQASQDFQRGLTGRSIDALGGETLAGSGFETEEPEPGFSDADSGGEE